MDINELLNREYLTTHDFYRDVIDLFVLEANSEIGYLHFFDASADEIELNVWSTNVLAHCHTSHDTHYPLGSAGIWADSIRLRKPVIHNNYADKHAGLDSLPEGHIALMHHISLPLFDSGNIVAVIGFGRNKSTYQQDDVERFCRWANKIWLQIITKAEAIENSNSVTKADFELHTPYSILIDMLAAISRALEIRDEYTSSHQKNVSYISNLIANDLEMSEHQKEGLVIGALVHDIGKIAIPSQILNKTGQLLPAEYSLLQSHADAGSRIFSHVVFPWPIIEMIEQHHERLDGSGYPRGLKGQQIVMEARVIAVADTFDAMASDRPYRKALGAKNALEILNKGRNTLYDPYVVDAFLRCYAEDQTLGGRYTPIEPSL